MGFLLAVLAGVSAILALFAGGVAFEAGKGVRPNGTYQVYPFPEFPALSFLALLGALGCLVVIAIVLVVALRVSTATKAAAVVLATIGAVALYGAYVGVLTYV
jgi:hypothetical protein